MGVKVEIKNTADGDRLLKELQELKNLQVKIGYQSGKNKDDKGVDYADIAAWNELGTSNGIPSRPFMRNAIDNHKGELEECMKAQTQALINGATARQVLEQTGLFVKDLVQNEITTGSFEPNKERTKKRKGSDKPLIDTGTLRRSAGYFIEKKGGN